MHSMKTNQQPLITGDRVSVVDHHGIVTRSGVVTSVYTDGLTVGVRYDSGKHTNVLPTRFVVRGK